MTTGELTERLPVRWLQETGELRLGESLGGRGRVGGQRPLLDSSEAPPAQAGLGWVCGAGCQGLWPEDFSQLGLPGFEP